MCFPMFVKCLFIWIRCSTSSDVVLLDTDTSSNSRSNSSSRSRNNNSSKRRDDDDDEDFHDILISTEDIEVAQFWCDLICSRQNEEKKRQEEELKRRCEILRLFVTIPESWEILSAFKATITSLYCTALYAWSLYIHFGREVERETVVCGLLRPRRLSL